MAVPFSNTKLRVPKGFQNVLEGLAREVLRCQPDNIYSFAADYFEELLRKRQETGYDDITLLGAKLEDRFYNNHSFKNPNTNTNNEEQQSAAVKIQSEYRRFAAKKDYDSKKEEEAAIVIQASVRGHLERQTHKLDSNDEVNEPEEEIDIDLNDPDVEKAAVKIQSAYKGFRNRKTTENIHITEQTSQHQQPELKEDSVEPKTTVEIDLQISKEIESDEHQIIQDENQNNQENNLEESQNVNEESTNVTEENIEDIQTTEDIHHRNTEDDNLEETQATNENQQEGEDENIEETVTIDENLGDEKNKFIEGLKGLEEENRDADDLLDVDNLIDEREEKAAVKIQSVYKGFRTRKNMNTKKNDEIIENQEIENDEITNITDNLPNETENTADQEADDSQIDLGVKPLGDSDDMKESMDLFKTENEEAFIDVEEVTENQNEDLLDADKINETSLEIDDQINNEEFNEENKIENEKEEVIDGVSHQEQEEFNEEKKIENEKEEVMDDVSHQEQLDITHEDKESIIETNRSVENAEDNENNQESKSEVHEGNESVMETNRSLEEVEIENQKESEIHEEKESLVDTNKSLDDAVEIEDQETNENNQEVNENITTEMEAQDPGISINNEVNIDENEVNEGETVQEIIDTERTVDVTNDLEDSNVDHQESNQVISNPDNENNQESEIIDDANNGETGRTETDE